MPAAERLQVIEESLLRQYPLTCEENILLSRFLRQVREARERVRESSLYLDDLAGVIWEAIQPKED
jgi:hypothetical protein